MLRYGNIDFKEIYNIKKNISNDAFSIFFFILSNVKNENKGKGSGYFKVIDIMKECKIKTKKKYYKEMKSMEEFIEVKKSQYGIYVKVLNYSRYFRYDNKINRESNFLLDDPSVKEDAQYFKELERGQGVYSGSKEEIQDTTLSNINMEERGVICETKDVSARDLIEANIESKLIEDELDEINEGLEINEEVKKQVNRLEMTAMAKTNEEAPQLDREAVIPKSYDDLSTADNFINSIKVPKKTVGIIMKEGLMFRYEPSEHEMLNVKEVGRRISEIKGVDYLECILKDFNYKYRTKNEGELPSVTDAFRFLNSVHAKHCVN